MLKQGQKFYICGDSHECGIEQYNCNVNSVVTVEEDIQSNRRKKVLVTIESIDHDNNVCTYVFINKLRSL